MTGTGPENLYPQLLGDGFAALPAAVRQAHAFGDHIELAGRGDVERSGGVFTRAAFGLLGFPPPLRDVAVHVTLSDRSRRRELWRRDFAGHRFASWISRSGAVIAERFGPFVVRLVPTADADGITLACGGFSIFGLPLPRPLWPRVAARIDAPEGCYRFDIAAALPTGGQLRYSGWLAPAPAAKPGAVLIYDGECPFCSRFSDYVKLREEFGAVELVNAHHTDHPEVREVMRRGFDLDAGIVIRVGEAYHHGADCLRAVAAMSARRRWHRRLAARAWSSARFARWSYPVLRGTRKLAIRVLGRPKVAQSWSRAAAPAQTAPPPS